MNLFKLYPNDDITIIKEGSVLTQKMIEDAWIEMIRVDQEDIKANTFFFINGFKMN